jgi:hypothetical protein
MSRDPIWPLACICALRRYCTGEHELENFGPYLCPLFVLNFGLTLALHKSIWPLRTVDGQYTALTNFDFGAAKTSTSLKTLKHLLPSHYRGYSK